MIVYWLIFIFILYFAFRDWKRMTIIWLPLSLLFNECVCLKYTSPALSLVLAVDFTLLFIFLCKSSKKKKQLNHQEFFFKKVFIAYLISYGISMLFSIAPFNDVFTKTIKYFIQNFVILYLFQKAITDIKDIKLFSKTIFIVAVLIITVALIETISKDNFILDYIYLNSPQDAIEGKMYYTPPFLTHTGELQQRFGMVRAYSFFAIHIEFGCACVLLLFYYMYLNKFKNRLIEKKRLAIGIILFLAGIFLCNSKTPLIGLCFFLLGIVSIKDIIRIQIIMPLIILVIIANIYLPDFANNFIALFDSNIAEEGGGSNAEMRIQQFAVGLHLFEMSPITGNGIGALAVLMKNANYEDLLGAESSWLKILPERGIIGAIAYIYLYYIIYVKLAKYINKRALIFFLIGLMGMETATGFMSMPLYGSIIIAIYSMEVIKRNKKLPTDI